MNHERLWAPWRLAYIKSNQESHPADDAAGSATDNAAHAAAAGKPLELPPGADPNCFICRGAADDRDRQNLIVDRGPLTVAVLNRFPYNNGHLLIAPRRHCGRLDELAADEHAGCMSMLTSLVKRLERLMSPDGFNVGLNLGRVAGAGLPGHLHWHVVPRWLGDTSFMPVVADVNVIPQSLDELWESLRSHGGKH